MEDKPRVEIYGRGTEFRFVQFWDGDVKYCFLLHKHTVLVREHDEREFSVLDNGDLLIYKNTERWYMKPREVAGIIFPADMQMVKDLKEALADDAIEDVLLC